MSSKKHFFEIIERFWWVVAIAVLIILLFIPAKVGLPEQDYRGCERESSICVTSQVKALSREDDSSMVVSATVPPQVDGEEEVDVSFRLNSYDDSISVGNTIVMDFNQDKNEASLFIEKDTNLLWKLATGVLWYGPTATIDLDTYEEAVEDR